MVDDLREPVDVICLHKMDGTKIPVKYKTADGSVVKIERILDSCRLSMLRAGGRGMRYTCQVALEGGNRKAKMLLFEEDGCWFAEIH